MVIHFEKKKTQLPLTHCSANFQKWNFSQQPGKHYFFINVYMKKPNDFPIRLMIISALDFFSFSLKNFHK